MGALETPASGVAETSTRKTRPDAFLGNQPDLGDAAQVDVTDSAEGHAEVLPPALGQRVAAAGERRRGFHRRAGSQDRAVAVGVGERDPEPHRAGARVDDRAQVEPAVGAQVPRLGRGRALPASPRTSIRPRGSAAAARPGRTSSATGERGRSRDPSGTSVSDRSPTRRCTAGRAPWRRRPADPSTPGRTVTSPPPSAWLRTSALPAEGTDTGLPSNIGSTDVVTVCEEVDRAGDVGPADLALLASTEPGRGLGPAGCLLRTRPVVERGCDREPWGPLGVEEVVVGPHDQHRAVERKVVGGVGGDVAAVVGEVLTLQVAHVAVAVGQDRDRRHRRRGLEPEVRGADQHLTGDGGSPRRWAGRATRGSHPRRRGCDRPARHSRGRPGGCPRR